MFVMIYLDNSATTKPDASVLETYQTVSETFFANPASIHKLGGEVEKIQMKAREQVSHLLQVDPEEIIFTSGGTEGNNLAIKGIALKHQTRGNHIITTEVEHPSVYEACKSLETLGFNVTYLPVNEAGEVAPEDVEKSITDETILISIMHVNNEIGTIQPIERIGKIASKHPKLFFHVDAVQSLGKIPLPLKNSGIDLCTYSGHKINGLNGTGVLYVRSGVSLYPLFHGGNQQFNIRSGTEHVAGNVAFARALRLAKEREEKSLPYIKKLNQTLRQQLTTFDDVTINSPIQAIPHILNVSVLGIKPEVMIHQLAEESIIISTQSACSSKQMEKSRILLACGATDDVALSGLRISLSHETLEQEINEFLNVFARAIAQLKEILE